VDDGRRPAGRDLEDGAIPGSSTAIGFGVEVAVPALGEFGFNEGVRISRAGVEIVQVGVSLGLGEPRCDERTEHQNCPDKIGELAGNVIHGEFSWKNFRNQAQKVRVPIEYTCGEEYDERPGLPVAKQFGLRANSCQEERVCVQFSSSFRRDDDAEGAASSAAARLGAGV